MWNIEPLLENLLHTKFSKEQYDHKKKQENFPMDIYMKNKQSIKEMGKQKEMIRKRLSSNTNSKHTQINNCTVFFP